MNRTPIHHSLFLLLVVAITVAATVARAQESPLVWEIVGQPVNSSDLFMAGDTAVYAIGVEGLFAIRPDDTAWERLIEFVRDRAIYAVSTGTLFAILDGMVRSTDGGLTWGDFLDDVDAVLELPSGTLIATENACCGIARSTDDGVTWTLIDLGDIVTPAYVPKGLAYAPSSPNRAEGRLVTVGRDGAAYSTDEGVTWAPSNLVEPFGFLGHHVVYSAFDDSLYAMINGDPGDGGGGTGLVWASADGEVWTLRGRVPTGGDESPGQIVAAPDGKLWAIIPGDINGEVFSSSDAGRTWASRGAVDGPAIIGSEVRVKKLRVGPQGRLWLGTTDAEPGPGGTGAVLRTVEPVVVSSEEGPEGSNPSAGVALSAPYPNPASRAVTVPLVLPEAAVVSVAVFDVLGRSVATLHEGWLSAGAHRFVLHASALPSGVYLVRVEGSAGSLTRRFVIAR